MALYDYECQSCSYVFEVSQSIKDKPLEFCGLYCPIQDIGKVKRLISRNFSVIFKGKGFYENDYKKKGGR